MAVISGTLTTGTPNSSSVSQRAPPPLTAIARMLVNAPPTVLSNLPRAPAAAATGSPVSIVTTTISPSWSNTASVVEPPISIPTIINLSSTLAEESPAGILQFAAFVQPHIPAISSQARPLALPGKTHDVQTTVAPLPVSCTRRDT